MPKMNVDDEIEMAEAREAAVGFNFDELADIEGDCS